MPRGKERRSDWLGEGLTWLCGGALALNVLLVLALLGILALHGLPYFWQRDVVLLQLADGSRILGELHEVERGPGTATRPGSLRTKVKVGNRDFAGADFVWIDDDDVRERSRPEDAVVLERLEWGNFYGWLRELRRGDERLAAGSDDVWRALKPLVEAKAEERDRIRTFERREIGDVNAEIERLRLAQRRIAISHLPDAERKERSAEIDRRMADEQVNYEKLAERLGRMREDLLKETLVIESAAGKTKSVPVGHVVDAVRANALSTFDKSWLYARRAVGFVLDEPRESNTEGGIFPAIFGTVLMVFLMSFAVVPLGVLAALYLREYAKQGAVVRLVRIAVNNLAGVPSIVFGVFGLGFFVYLIGGTIDRIFYPELLPTPTYGTGGILWAALTLALLTVPVVIVATEEGLAAVPRIVREGSLAMGATKLETTWRVVVPAAAPGILTGMILAMARAAGEVAPLMIVGMVKLAPALPVDGHFPWLHVERKFMHLGFHIFDIGFQSPNVDATKPLVYATALLLIAVVTAMNLVAILIRNHLRAKYSGSAV